MESEDCGGFELRSSVGCECNPDANGAKVRLNGTNQGGPTNYLGRCLLVDVEGHPRLLRRVTCFQICYFLQYHMLRVTMA